MVGQPVFAVIMITVGLLFVLNEVVTWIWGQRTLDLGDPWGRTRSTVGDVVLPVKDLWTLGAGRCRAWPGSSLLFRWSDLGLAMRATAIDQEAAMARGINVRRVFTLSWAIAAAVAALAGVTLAPVRRR
jgi:branched-chain amino acid transport system permease protein